MKPLNQFIAESNVPAKMTNSLKGGTQYDWIIYDDEYTKLFCIAIWQENNKWVLGEYVNMLGGNIPDMVRMGYMTMLEAAKGRDRYRYIIAKHTFDVDKEIKQSDYWKSLVKQLDGKSSPSSPIELDEFLLHMKAIVPEKSIDWKQFR